MMDMTGPVETPQGYVFTFRLDIIECSDVPVAVHTLPAKSKDAVKWAKENVKDLFYPPSDDYFYLGVPSLEEAVFFKLMWM
jgi:hypothetical protein